MFFCDKYAPRKINDFVFNKNIACEMQYLSKNDKMPHIIICGDIGSGKNTLKNFLLEQLFDKTVHNVNKVIYKINNNNTNNKSEYEIQQSNFHISIDDIDNNYDKYIIQSIVKKYVTQRQFNFTNVNRSFKIILINNVDKLSFQAQTALRATMEQHMDSCRFIMICNNFSKIIEPLKSRCKTFKIPSPRKIDIFECIIRIVAYEQIPITQEQIKQIIENSNYNIKKTMWLLNLLKYNINFETTNNEAIKNIVNEILILIDTIKNKKTKILPHYQNIRNYIYGLTVTGIETSEIIIMIINSLLKILKNDEEKKILIKYASHYEHLSVVTRREMTHIEAFLYTVIDKIVKL